MTKFEFNEFFKENESNDSCRTFVASLKQGKYSAKLFWNFYDKGQDVF